MRLKRYEGSLDNWKIIGIVSLLSIVSFALFILGMGSFFVDAVVNETQISRVEVGNSPPEVHNITINTDTQYNISSLALTAGVNTTVDCSGIVLDWNGQEDIAVINATLYASGWGADYSNLDDNNYHYSATNETLLLGVQENNCTWDLSYGDGYEAFVNCSFDLTYYAYNGTWTCNITSWDQNNAESVDDYDTVEIQDLIALNVPNLLDFGIVNVTLVSYENTSDVENYGNVNITFALRGYDSSGDPSLGIEGDPSNAMNCTNGLIKNITIDYERYNVSESVAPILDTITFNDFYNTGNYTGLTGTEAVVPLNITAREFDNTGNYSMNTTYWRVYVPVGVGGTCEGIIVYTAQEIIESVV